MYTHSQIAIATRLAAIDHYKSVSNMLLGSTARLLDLYSDTGSKALDLTRRGATLPGFTLSKELGAELFVGHLLIAGHVHEDLVRLVEAQVHRSGSIAKFALDKTVQMSPPLVESVIDATESIISAGESAADELGDASIKAVDRVEKKVLRSSRAKRSKAK